MPQTTGAREVIRVVPVIEILQLHVATGLGCVHKAPIARVDADVRNAAARETEEDEIAGRKIVPGDRNRRVELLLRRARNAQTQLLMDEIDKATAVEAFEIRSAITIGCSNLRHGTEDDFITCRG